MISALLGGIQAKLILAGAVILAICGVLLKVFFMGKAAEKVADQSKALKRIAKAKKVENEVSHTDDDTIRDRMRKHGWFRK